MSVTEPIADLDLLPEPFAGWFAARGWVPRPHQRALLAKARAGRSALLIAPTGAGKTLAGFLPSLVELAATPRHKPGTAASRASPLHTLYISPLKALAVDVARNLETPIAEMGLDIRVETRTGDTPQSKRQRQRYDPPQMLMTTPEQIALLIASREAPTLFANLKTIVLDELHALVTSKRGDLLALGIARLRSLAPGLRVVGLSATVADPQVLARWPMDQSHGPNADTAVADLVVAESAVAPDVSILAPKERVPWAGHSARYALGAIYEAIRAHQTTLVFVNTRSQAEMLFQELWRINEDGLAIALHHGSLDVGQRRKVEAAMVAGALKAVVCTSTLDLGVDWGDIDLVVNVGAPKGASRLAQRIGRANHRLDEPSKALLVPANRFEVMECEAALEALAENAQDSPPPRTGALDVLAQHVLGSAVAAPFDADALYREVTGAAAYADLDRATFDRVVDFVATGGYALKTYERYARIRRTPEGRWRVSNPKVAQQYRLNVGTIVEAPMLKVRLVRGGRSRALVGGRMLGEIEEWFVDQLAPGDTFVFAGHILRLEGLRETEVYVSRAVNEDAKVPSYQGGKFPLSTYLADRVRAILADERLWRRLPGEVGEWLGVQKLRSVIPRRDQLLVETFPRGARFYLVCYPFEGRLAHQTLGMLLTRRLERMRARPLGFVASEYALAVWGLGDIAAMIRMGRLSLGELFDQDMLGDDLEAWLAESSLMKRTFRTCATISGLIERRHPGKEKTGRQMTVSSDLIYDVLMSHEPDHVLLQATRADAATGLLDVTRVGDMLRRTRGRIVHQTLDRVSPLAVPVLLEIGKEPVHGEADESLLAEAADALIAEAMGEAAVRPLR
ncbi:ligase-associated DNA damage response DEXH box helicase [Microbaculum marinisediminis]|uniref:Ligase-associated DNA damage response DEXH box helicase n=1 Tax=Microbaculum marinisediminis TaxID=2931392 RepID=A0AAW5QTZ9_9HYPH|nr:ligase-associated DNA damage response DEXH box helicase [Microbaculum sp. A6E488]MCT8970687.1 ligase-associated DNA damage response DEXH box helicase [Microbaculum sp. A6E488]